MMLIPKRPATVNVLGVIYQIQYVASPSEVDIFKRESFWGQIDYWTRTIRVYDNARTAEDIWQTLFHEVLHAVAQQLHLKALEDKANHDELDIIALAMIDVLSRNGWMCFGEDGTV